VEIASGLEASEGSLIALRAIDAALLHRYIIHSNIRHGTETIAGRRRGAPPPRGNLRTAIL
jgi:hypothetical protein